MSWHISTYRTLGRTSEDCGESPKTSVLESNTSTVQTVTTSCTHGVTCACSQPTSSRPRSRNPMSRIMIGQPTLTITPTPLERRPRDTKVVSYELVPAREAFLDAPRRLLPPLL